MIKSKYIVSTALAAVMAIASLNPASASEPLELNQFNNSQSTLVNNSNTVNSMINDGFHLTDHMTGELVSLQDAMKKGGSYNSPDNSSEVLYINVDNKNSASRNEFKKRSDYTRVKNKKSATETAFNNLGVDFMTVNFIAQSSKGTKDADYMTINTDEVQILKKNMYTYGLKRQQGEYVDLFVFSHEMAHSAEHIEHEFNDHSLAHNSKYESINKREYHSDIYGAIVVYKQMISDYGLESGLEKYKNFSSSLVEMRSHDAYEYNNRTNQTDTHYTVPALLALSNIIEQNPELVSNLNNEEALKFSNLLVEEVLNHKYVKNHIHSSPEQVNEFNTDFTMKQTVLPKIADDVAINIISKLDKEQQFAINTIKSDDEILSEIDSAMSNLKLKNSKKLKNKI